ncbi:hypothetical protein QWY84_06485 [Aquisalimonas lutea]|nr:hypothetical protein [Aquisalimonas lutea]
MSRSAVVVSMVLLLGSPALAQQDHAPAPMMAPAQGPLTSQARAAEQQTSGRTRDAEAILAAFAERFGDAPPAMAVYWNRAFGDRVSDWASTQRSVVVGSESVRSDGPEGATRQDTELSLAAQSETRGGPRDNSGSARLAFALEAGFVERLRGAGIRVLDRRALMRITDNALEDGSFSRLSPDLARLEMRSLAQHADFVVELRRDGPDRFRITVLSVADGSVQALFSSNGVPPEEGDAEPRWITTAQGFERRERPVSLGAIGGELALLTLAGMSGL